MRVANTVFFISLVIYSFNAAKLLICKNCANFLTHYFFTATQYYTNAATPCLSCMDEHGADSSVHLIPWLAVCLDQVFDKVGIIEVNRTLISDIHLSNALYING